MYLKSFGLFAVLFPLMASAQYMPVENNSAGATFQYMQQQQNYILQTQMAQQAAAAKALQDQQAAAIKNAQTQSMISSVVGLCTNWASRPSGSESALGKTGTDLENVAHDMDTVAYADMEKKGHTYLPDLDQTMTRDIGSDASANFAKGCDNFIDKEGKLGAWGQYALSQISTKKSFGNEVPDDIVKWCPKYPSMTKPQRDLYWVWILMSMASSESSCNPKADNPNAPNGVAKGLFQVWKPVCPKSRNLSNPNENIQCAVDLLDKELTNRDTLMTPTSSGREGTYWGPLRSDDNNKRRGGDIAGAKKTRGLMEKYRFCK